MNCVNQKAIAFNSGSHLVTKGMKISFLIEQHNSRGFCCDHTFSIWPLCIRVYLNRSKVNNPRCFLSKWAYITQHKRFQRDISEFLNLIYVNNLDIKYSQYLRKNTKIQNHSMKHGINIYKTNLNQSLHVHAMFVAQTIYEPGSEKIDYKWKSSIWIFW